MYVCNCLSISVGLSVGGLEGLVSCRYSAQMHNNYWLLIIRPSPSQGNKYILCKPELTLLHFILQICDVYLVRVVTF